MSDKDELETYHCEVCGKDLTDPKNSGDPDENGDWVFRSISCRAAHSVEMTVTIDDRRLVTDGGVDGPQQNSCRHDTWALENLRPPAEGNPFDEGGDRVSAHADCGNCGETVLLDMEIKEVLG